MDIILPQTENTSVLSGLLLPSLIVNAEPNHKIRRLLIFEMIYNLLTDLITED